MAIPIASLNGAASDDVTGSIAKPEAEQFLAAADWRLAKRALATALDPSGSGQTVRWDNPASGSKGSFSALGKAYSSNAKTCRVFLGQLDRGGATQSAQGTACSEKGGEWTIAEADPWKTS
jgi:surface antigen